MKQFHRKFLGFRIGPPFRSSPRVHNTCLTSDETTTEKKIRVTEVHASKSLQFWTSVRAALKLRTLLSHCIWIVWFFWVVLYPPCYELGRAYFCLSCWPIFVGWEAWSGFGFIFHFNLLGGVTCCNLRRLNFERESFFNVAWPIERVKELGWWACGIWS